MTFTCATDRMGSRRWISVRIHDNTDSLRRAAHRLAPHADGPSYWDGCAGCFHGLEPTANGYVGLLRLSREHLTAEVVAHELVHAACAVARSYGPRDLRLTDGVRMREEELAYIYGELFADFQANYDKENP